MGDIAFVFPGQGAQYTGMGRELYESSQAARAVFDIAESARPGTLEQCFSGSAAELAKTENTQPCVFCVDLAAAQALQEAGVTADRLAGFSLGELAALAFADAVTYEDGFNLVCKRAELMQKASDEAPTGMAAVLRLTDETVADLCAGFENVYPVNFNCDGQVVVAGAAHELGLFMRHVKETGGRAMPLKVGGGFHSPFMAKAARRFTETLTTFEIGHPQLPVYSNATAKPYDGDLRALMVKQIHSPVLWRATIENMISAGVDTFIECGPGKTLCGLVSRISHEARVFNVEDRASFDKTVYELAAHDVM